MPKRKPVLGIDSRPLQKQPVLGASIPPADRIPGIAVNISQQGTPSFQFKRMDFTGPFSWQNAKRHTWLKILGQLGKIESLNRSQCIAQGSHDYPIANCSKKARDRFTELNLDVHFDSVFSIRLEGRLRIICIDRWPVLEILWLDTNHEVYPSKLKHT